MGGWAWIAMSSDVSYFELFIDVELYNWTIKKKKISDNWIELWNVSMEWYQDWLSGINKYIFNYKINVDISDIDIEEALKYWKQELLSLWYDKATVDSIKEFNISCEYKTELDDMLWSGYIRWNIEDVDSFESNTEREWSGYLVFDINWTNEVINLYDSDFLDDGIDVEFTKKDKEDFDFLFNQVFNDNIDDSDINEYRESFPDDNLSDDEIMENIQEQRNVFLKNEYCRV